MIAHPETRARLQTVCIALVALVAVVTAMRLAKGLLAPVTLGLIVAIVAAPGMRLLARLGIPRAVSASISLVFVGALTMLLIAGLGPIVMDLIGQVPRIEDEIRWWVIDASRAIRGLESVQFELEQSLTEDGEAVEEAMPSLLDAVSVAPNFAALACSALRRACLSSFSCASITLSRASVTRARASGESLSSPLSSVFRRADADCGVVNRSDWTRMRAFICSSARAMRASCPAISSCDVRCGALLRPLLSAITAAPMPTSARPEGARFAPSKSVLAMVCPKSAVCPTARLAATSGLMDAAKALI